MDVLCVGNDLFFIHSQEFGRVLVLKAILGCLKHFTDSLREEISDNIDKLGSIKFVLAAILAFCGGSAFVVASFAVSGAALNGIACVVRRVPTSDGRRISQVVRLSNVYQSVFRRPHFRCNARRRRSATRSSTSGTGGNANSGDGCSDGDGSGHRVTRFLSYLFPKFHSINFSNRFLPPYSLRAYGSIYVCCCQRLRLEVAR